MLSAALALLALADPKPARLTVDLLVSDMTQPHEARPSGVTDAIDWSRKPRISMGNNPGEWTAFIPWGQLYVAEGGNPSANTRVEIRNLRGWILSKRTGKWTLVSESTTGIEGAAYAEDFANDRNKPAEAKPVGNGVVVNAGNGYNYHFWPKSGRVSIDPKDVGGVVVVVEARLVLADPSGPDDRSKARYLMSVGADYWAKLDSQWDHFKTNADVAIGRFRFVREAWQPFTMTSLTGDDLRKNPPPLR